VALAQLPVHFYKKVHYFVGSERARRGYTQRKVERRSCGCDRGEQAAGWRPQPGGGWGGVHPHTALVTYVRAVRS
jgi:hypothetical protein